LLDSFNQDFILKDCFVKELLHFYHGVEILAGRRRYFVQIRAGLHGYDTRALQPILRVRQENHKLNRCPLCRLVSTHLNKVYKGLAVVEGGRYLLPLNHFLRAYGQSLQCCPQDQYFSEDLNETLQEGSFGLPQWRGKTEDIEPLAIHFTLDATPTLREFFLAKYEALQPCDPTFQAHNRYRVFSDFKATLLRGDVNFEFYHQRFGILLAHMNQNMYFPYLDYRHQVRYSRVKNEEYLSDGNYALSHKRDCNGVYGTWLYALLPYARVDRQVCWDPFHTLMNIGRDTLKTLKAERSQFSVVAINHAKLTKVHPFMYRRKKITNPLQKVRSLSSRKARRESKVDDEEQADNDDEQQYAAEQAPYVLAPDARTKVEEAIKCILIPLGYSQHFRVSKEIFSRLGDLIGTEKIHIISVLMEFILWLVYEHYDKDYPIPYLLFYYMLSLDFCDLQAPSFTEHEISDLHFRCIELVEMHTGLFPATEHSIKWHQLVDIVPFIRVWGPLRGWWTLPMERALSDIKEGLPQGGSSSHLTAMRRQVLQEISSTKELYAFTADGDCEAGYGSHRKGHKTLLRKLTDKGGGLLMKIGEQPPTLCYTDRAISLRHFLPSTSISLEPFEANMLLSALSKEVRRLALTINQALIKSCLYRLWYSCLIFSRNEVPGAPRSLKGGVAALYTWMFLVNEDLQKDANESFVLSKIIDEAPPENAREIIDNIRRGKLYEADIIQMRSNWLHINQIDNVYLHAVIFGIQFRARGIDFRESEQVSKGKYRCNVNAVGAFYGKQRYIYANKDENFLRTHFYEKNQYSSWFRFSTDEEQRGNNTGEFVKVERSGQFNCFFRIRSRQSDPLIDGIPFASVVVRNSTRVQFQVRDDDGTSQLQTKMHEINCLDEATNRDAHENYEPDIRFIPITSVHSTALGCVAFARRDQRPHSYKEFQRSDQILQKLVLIPLQPYRVNSNKFEHNKAALLYHNAGLDCFERLQADSQNNE